MEILFSEEFKKDYRKIKDQGLRLRIVKAFRKLAEMPEKGKPLRYGHKGERRIRIDLFRIIYGIERDKIKVLCFEHRGKAY